MSRRIRPVGDGALLIDCADLDEVLGVAAALRAMDIDGLVEVMPAARTVLVTFRPEVIGAGMLRGILAGVEPSRGEEAAGREHRIPVRYDGEDLAEVAGLLGIEPRELVERHTAGEYRVAFAGFAPGFAYLTGGHDSLDVPRRDTPRTRIPAGAVGLAGTFSGVYPRQSPGGWQLIGTALVPMWDECREPPALLQPGDRVRFVDVEADPGAAPEGGGGAAGSEDTGRDSEEQHDGVSSAPALEVTAAALPALVQDGGRGASASIGAPPSGALDLPALREANRLVGNPGEAPALEITMGGLEIRARGHITVTVTGAHVPLTVTRASGRTLHVEAMSPIALSEGDALALGEPMAGVRSYLAVRGGIDAPTVLGSAATDTLSGLGPAPVTAGRVLPVANTAPVAAVGRPLPWPEPPGPELEVPLVLGPREDWFEPASLELLCSQTWRVTPQSDRIGMRLEGEEPLHRAVTRELPSEGTVTGALQVPASGQPVLFLNDHPVTGGYPVIATVHSSALPRLAQVRPGTLLRFTVEPPRPEPEEPA